MGNSATQRYTRYKAPKTVIHVHDNRYTLLKIVREDAHIAEAKYESPMNCSLWNHSFDRDSISECELYACFCEVDKKPTHGYYISTPAYGWLRIKVTCVLMCPTCFHRIELNVIKQMYKDNEEIMMKRLNHMEDLVREVVVYKDKQELANMVIHRDEP